MAIERSVRFAEKTKFLIQVVPVPVLTLAYRGGPGLPRYSAFIGSGVGTKIFQNWFVSPEIYRWAYERDGHVVPAILALDLKCDTTFLNSTPPTEPLSVVSCPVRFPTLTTFGLEEHAHLRQIFRKVHVQRNFKINAGSTAFLVAQIDNEPVERRTRTCPPSRQPYWDSRRKSII